MRPDQINGWTAAWLAEVLLFCRSPIGIAWTARAAGPEVARSRDDLPQPRRSGGGSRSHGGLVLAVGTGLIFLLSLSDYRFLFVAVPVYALRFFRLQRKQHQRGPF